MIESMTHGGRKKQGIVFAPEDALSIDPVILKYLREYPEDIVVLKENTKYMLKNIEFSTGKKMYHDLEGKVENYGFKLHLPGKIISFITDTKFNEEIIASYKGDIVILNVLLAESKPHIFHLSLADIYNITKIIHPKKIILTHFGTTLATQNPREFTKRLSDDIGIEVIAAYDGMELYIDQ